VRPDQHAGGDGPEDGTADVDDAIGDHADALAAGFGLEMQAQTRATTQPTIVQSPTIFRTIMASF